MKHILAIGLNAALQRTMKFDHVTVGAVNRAAAECVSPGGKAVLFSRAAHALLPGSAMPAYFAGGRAGVQIIDGLRALGIKSLAIPTAAETRTCTTVVDETGGTSTELIGPTGCITPHEAAQMRGALLDAAEDAAAIAFCGTYPDPVDEKLFVELVSTFGDKPILLDACKGVEPLLHSGRITFLNVNLDECRTLTGKADVGEIADHCTKHYNISNVMITDGPRNAHLFTPSEHHEFTLECIEIVNPIGAGDTCSGVTLAAVISGDPVEVAFSKGLAAATASCLQLEPAVFSLETMRRFQSRMTIRTESRA